jgi:hypothetical protein
MAIGFFSILMAQKSQFKLIYQGKLDVLNHLSLSEDEEFVLDEILLLNDDIRMAEREIAFTSKRIEELKQICSLSNEFEDIKTKADKKYKRSLGFVSYLESDLEEYRSIENKLLYQIYANQLTEKTRTLKYKKNPEVKKFKKEAERLNSIAEKTLKIVNSELSDIQLVDSLKKMNCLYSQAIDNQREALAICLNIELKKEQTCQKKYNTDFNSVYADIINIEVMDNEEERFEDMDLVNIYNLQKDEAQIQTKPQVQDKSSVIVEDNRSSLLDISQAASMKRLDINHQDHINKNIVYKVQVGAFYSDVNKNDFKGLDPIMIDNDEDFSKVMVGSYFSYKAAMKSRHILINTTEYKDNKRIPLSEAINQLNDSSDKQAYMTFKNTENK